MSVNIRVLDIIEDRLSGKEIFFRYIKTVGDLMTRPVIQVTLSHTLKEVLDTFAEHKIRHVTVIDIDEKTIPDNVTLPGTLLGLLLVTLIVGSGTGGVSRWVSIFGLQFTPLPSR